VGGDCRCLRGVGAAFASALAKRDFNLALIARRPGPLESRSAELQDRYGITVKTISTDLAARIYDTAYMLIGSFPGNPFESHLRAIDVSCRGPLILTVNEDVKPPL
jgi:hypothetical protein